MPVAAPLPVVLDRTDDRPLYQQLADQLREAITTGALRPGDPVENELALATRLRVSRPTVRRAIGDLTAQGLLVRRRGVGTRVANQVMQPGDEVTSLWDDLARAGRSPRTAVLRHETGVTHPRAAEALGLPATTGLVYLERIRYADGDPLAHLVNWLPPQFADLTDTELGERGLYDSLRARGHEPVRGRQLIRARIPTGEQRRLLHITRADAVLLMLRHTVDSAGTPVEYGEHCYRGDQYTFSVTV